MNHIMLVAMISGAGMVMHDGGPTKHIVGYLNANKDDPRKVPIDLEKFKSLLPLSDRRGCHRWRWNGSQVEAIPPSERVPPVDQTYPIWRELADLRTAYETTKTWVDNHPALRSEVLRRIDELQARLDEMTRPGRGEDEP